MVRELAEGIWWLDLGGVNAYLVDDPGSDGPDGNAGGLTLIDAGKPNDAAAIEAAIEAAGFALAEIERVLITHYDIDHVGALGRLDGLEAPVSVGAADAGLLRGEHPNWTNHKGALQFATGPLIDDPSLPIEPIADGTQVGGFVAYHTPGHTPGHVTYVNEARSAAFLGDLVLENEGELTPSPWFVSYDTGEVAGSIAALVSRVPDFAVAAMGHGVPFVAGGSDRLRECSERI